MIPRIASSHIITVFLFLFCLAAEPSYARSSLSSFEIRRIIVEEAVRWNVKPELALAVAKVESNFSASAVSSAGAIGVMQIMPATAMGEFGVEQKALYNPRVNIELGVRYLRHLLDKYEGNEEIALSHYNGGSKVRRSNGTLAVIPYTRGYVNRVLSQTQRYRSHSLVLAAKRGNGAPTRRERMLAQLDDFGGGVNLSRRAQQHSGFESVSVPISVPVGELSTERADLVRKLRELRFRNHYRSVGNHSNAGYSEPLDDF